MSSVVERRVALVASSGGSTLRGGALSEHAALSRQLGALELGGPQRCRLAWMVYVEASTPLDHASPSSEVALWRCADGGGSAPSLALRGPLASVALEAQRADEEVARCIERGEVAALVLASADVRATNAASMRAAAAAGTPVLGTGGTGLGLAHGVARNVDPEGLIAYRPSTSSHGEEGAGRDRQIGGIVTS